MSNFDNVFAAIKAECAKQQKFAELSCFDLIAARAGVPETKLSLYLGHLQQVGLIRYSLADKYIYLTALGKALDQVPQSAV